MVSSDRAIHAHGVAFASLSAVFYLKDEFAVLCDKYITGPPWMVVLSLAVMGCAFGCALGLLLARRDFLDTEGQHWVSTWGASSVLYLRVRCAFVVALVGYAEAYFWYLALFEP